MAAATAKAPAGLPGLNLLPNLETGKPIDRDRIFGESFAHDIADIEKPEDSLLFRWVIVAGWKLILTYDGRQGRMVYPPTEFGPQLFNLKNDPHEKTNLAGEETARVERLSQRIGEWWTVSERKHGAPGP